MSNIDNNNKLKDRGFFNVQGHIKIFDPITKEVFINKSNAIHYENMAVALASSLSNQGYGFIVQMDFGNGGTRVDSTGIITYLTPNTVGNEADLYNKTYSKIIDASQSSNLDPARNFMEVRHLSGTAYADVMVNCLLDFGEPAGQSFFDNSNNTDNAFIFDELGLRAYPAGGSGTSPLLTHVIFHPVQKSLNRMIQIEYTVRIQSLNTGI